MRAMNDLPTQHKRLGYMPVYFPPSRRSMAQAIVNWLERRAIVASKRMRGW